LGSGELQKEQIKFYSTEYQKFKNVIIWNQKHKKNTSLIEVNDILEVITQNIFSNQKLVELLQILNYTLYKKNYPHDLCGIIDRKIQILQQPDTTCPQSPQNQDVASFKDRSIVILELLKI